MIININWNNDMEQICEIKNKFSRIEFKFWSNSATFMWSNYIVFLHIIDKTNYWQIVAHSFSLYSLYKLIHSSECSENWKTRTNTLMYWAVQCATKYHCSGFVASIDHWPEPMPCATERDMKVSRRVSNITNIFLLYRRASSMWIGL